MLYHCTWQLLSGTTYQHLTLYWCSECHLFKEQGRIQDFKFFNFCGGGGGGGCGVGGAGLCVGGWGVGVGVRVGGLVGVGVSWGTGWKAGWGIVYKYISNYRSLDIPNRNCWWRHQDITWNSVDLSPKVFCGIHLTAISEEKLM